MIKYSWLNPDSIEEHIGWLISAIIGVVLVLGFLLLNYMVTSWISNEYDRALVAKARALVTLTKSEGEYGEVELDFADEFMPEFETNKNPEYFQLWFEDGRVLERSNALIPNDLPHTDEDYEGERFFDLNLPDNRAGRAVEIVFLPQIEDKEDIPVDQLPVQVLMRLVVAREREALDKLLLTIHLSMLILIVIMIATMAYLIKLAIKTGLQPLHEVTEQLEALDARQLNSRLLIAYTPRELSPMITQFNALLQRLETSFRREQRFSSDVAHELRTPVAELRNLTEVAIRWPDDQQSLLRFFQDALDVSRNLQLIINNLLAMARCEEGNLKLSYQDIQLTDLLCAAWLRVQNEAQLKQLGFKIIGDTGISCYSCINELELILNNLFGNAVAYAKSNTEIVASILVETNTIAFTLSNYTEQLEQEDLNMT